MPIKFPSALDSIIGKTIEQPKEKSRDVVEKLPNICAGCMDDIVDNTVELFKEFKPASLKGS